jgi:DNA-binding IscR family transcriptional regulator
VLCAVDEILDPVFYVDRGQEPDCDRADGCPAHWLWAQLGEAIHGVLDSVTPADLCEHSHASGNNG